VDTSAAGRIATFDPARAWGAALDGHNAAELAGIYTSATIAAMHSAGLGPVTYRLRTELAIEAWHWNPDGTWSDSAHGQGYWTSSDHAARPLERSFGYRLPRRGRTVDDANNDGYSRLTDGDTASFWKSNPYLDPRYTGEREALHPQWVVVDLGAPRRVNAVRLAWGAPWATRFRVEYWDGDQTTRVDYNSDGRWRAFPGGTVTDGGGGVALLQLAPRPVTTRFVRLLLLAGSHTAPAGATDPRDSLGFALREISLGTLDGMGRLHDAVRHAPRAQSQTETLVSSTDPWHRASDRDSALVQPGLDLVFESGLTHGLPVLLPVPMLFDTPDNAAALLRYVRARGWPVPRLELGEEPDGHRIVPEDYAALYLQFARALRAIDPHITLGGPSWQNALNAWVAVWPERPAPGPRASWIGRFMDYLDARGRASDFGFLSFEWYPFEDPCEGAATQLARAPELLASRLAALRASGLPAGLPLILTEYGYSAHAGPNDLSLASALLNAATLAGFFAGGGSEAYVYGWEPGYLGRAARCALWGDNLLFLADSAGGAGSRLPAYYAARLLTRTWADSSGGAHAMHAVRVTGAGTSRLSAWALHRPDGRWSLLLVNRDPTHALTLDARFGVGADGRTVVGPLDIWSYSAEQYRWDHPREGGHPSRSEPPAHTLSSGGSVTVPAWSLMVLLMR
jgi:hypothetical protein